MNRSVFYILIASIFLFCCGCEHIKQRHQAGVVAEVAGQTLTEEDIAHLTSGLNAEDSARVAEQYIYDWAVSILQYEEASAERQARIEQMVSDYRRSLYRYEYERALVARQMPKEVADTLVEQFYAQHAQQFVLKESILKGVLIVLPEGTPKQDKLKKWLASIDEEQMEQIEKYVYQYATGYELFTDSWKTVNQLLLRLPTDSRSLQQEMRRHSLIELHDSTQVYILQITDKYFAGDIMPQDYAASEIERIILNQRELEFLQQKRHELYNDALKKKKIIRRNQ